MLSPNDIAPRSKAASIWSIDSGYGSNTLDEDEIIRSMDSTTIGPTGNASMDSELVNVTQSSPTHHVHSQSTQRPIGLGLGSFWSGQAEDQLQVSIAKAPIEPVASKFNVFTARPSSRSDFLVPNSSNDQDTCFNCQLWNITNPGENLRCDDCRERTFIAPQTPHSRHQRAKSAVPRLEIPHKQHNEQSPANHPAARCSACEISTLIDPAKPSNCPSCTPNIDIQSPELPTQALRARRSGARRAAKLPAHALRCLRVWLEENRSNPYPNAETKRSLASQCGITEKQVNTWFTNTRARRMTTSLDQSTHHSEDEGHYESRVSSVASTPVINDGKPFGYATPFHGRVSDTSAFAAKGLSGTASAISRRGKKKDYGAIKAASPIDEEASPSHPVLANTTASSTNKDAEQWQCTFCHHHVAPKSWRRHEETQHRPKRKWTCLLNGPRLTLPSRFNASNVCAFCMEENPTQEHFLKAHRIVECLQKHEKDRTFLRPDHLRQHVRNYHKVTLYEIVRDSWRRDGPGKDEVENWKCGFCDQPLRTWDIRETHIAGHFKDGKTMADWNEPKRSDSPVEISKRRRDSSDGSPNISTKLARTLSSESNRGIEHQSQLNNHFINTFVPFQTSAGPSLSTTTLLPDPVFESLMAEMSGNPVDSFNPIVTSANDNYNSIVTSENVSYIPHMNASATSYPAGEDGELDLDALTAAFFSRNPAEFSGPWDQQPE